MIDDPNFDREALKIWVREQRDKGRREDGNGLFTLHVSPEVYWNLLDDPQIAYVVGLSIPASNKKAQEGKGFQMYGVRVKC